MLVYTYSTLRIRKLRIALYSTFINFFMTVQRDRVFEMLTFRTVECYSKSGQPFHSWADEPLKRPGPYKSVIVSQRSQRGAGVSCCSRNWLYPSRSLCKINYICRNREKQVSVLEVGL